MKQAQPWQPFPKTFWIIIFLFVFTLAQPQSNAQQAQEEKQTTENKTTANEKPNPKPNPKDKDNDDLEGPFILVDMSAIEVLELFEELTGKTVLRQQNLPTVQINFKQDKPIPRKDAIIAIESLLSINGIALNPMGEKFIIALPANIAGSEAPEVITQSTVDLPPSQKIYSKLFQLNYLSTEEAIPFIQPFLTQGIANTVPFNKANAIMITDGVVNLQRVETVLEKIDHPAEMKEEIAFISLKHSEAEYIKTRVNGMQQSSLRKYLSGNTVIEADERTNQIILITHPQNIPLLRNIVDSLDIDVAPLTQSKVFYIKHAEANAVTDLIQQIIDGQRQNRDENSSTNNQNQNTDQPPGAEPPPTPPTNRNNGIISEIGRENLQFSEHITIVSDERGNAIIASGTESDLTHITQLIEKIDIRLPQVMIEVIFAEVNLVKGQSRGLDSFGVRYESLGGARDEVTLDPGGKILGGIGFNSPITLKDFTLDTVITASKTKSNVNVLSAPIIVTTHNQEADINVSQSRPILTGSTTTDGGNTTSSVQFRDIGIQLKIKPLIGANGTVQMEIEQIIETVVGLIGQDPDDPVENESLLGQPIIGKREARSFISIDDGELIVLAGLQQKELRKVNNRMFLLGEIPVLDEIFTRRSLDEDSTELIVFIQPTILADNKAIDKSAAERLKKNPNYQEIKNYLKDKKLTISETNKKP